ncbi:MAG TPA: PQQ-dependent sugar dehydrogenase, partial [Kofleriaceae bacterium]
MAALTALAACGGDKHNSNNPDGGDGSGSDDAGAGSADAGGIPSPFGLDTRPSNTTCLAKPRPVLDTGVKLERPWPDLHFNQPIFMTQAPNDPDTWYVAERGAGGPDGQHQVARIRIISKTTKTDADIKDWVSLTTDGEGEGGLLSFAFHPQWPTKNEVYISYTRAKAAGDPAIVCAENMDANMTSVIARYHGTPAALTPTADEIFKIGQPYTNHKGGTIAFGPDGYLYAGFGDGGNGDDTCKNGQNKGSFLGKMLRLDINSGAGTYKVPADNPFVGDAAFKPEIWSWGHRNPFRWSFDRDSGDLWVGDVGQNTWEEIDHVTKGGNYGWNVCEGFHKRGSTTELCNTPGMIDPVVEHNRTEAQAIIGGFVYHGTLNPGLAGLYIYGDEVTGNVWALTYDVNNKPTPKLLLAGAVQYLSGFAQDHNGEVYLVGIDGTLAKLVPSGTTTPDTFPTKLSQTGCVDPTDATKPAAGLIPYTVASPLWADGADKGRWLGLPDGKTITITADNDFDLPIGSVAVKEFAVGGVPIETRLFMRHADGGWAGYTYEWDADGKDATLLTGAKTKQIAAGRTWSYPSRSQCLQCHSQAAGGTIGLEVAQLNSDEVYTSTNRQSNQLATLDHIGVFTTPLAADPSTLPKLVKPTGADGSVEDRSRSYLHANCAHCHRPGGGGQGTMDLRYANALANTKTCNAPVTQGPV